MASNAIAGVGAQFQRWNSFGSQWETIAEVNAIVGPSRSRDSIDITSLSTLEGYREFNSGFKNGGKINLAMSFSRTHFELLKTDFESTDPNYYVILLPDIDNTSLYFTGLVIEMPITAEADDKISSNVTIQVTGEISMDEYSGLPSEEPGSEEPPESSDIPASSEDVAMLFLSGEFDFTNKVWLDQTGYGNDADLVDGYCLEILQDTTLTPVTSLSGLTVSQVNRAGVTTGVSVSGANLVFDFSALPDAKIESVILSDGQEFKFTTGYSAYIFSETNRGILSGTESTTWRWSTKNGLFLNLQDGCSIYPSIVNTTYRRGLNVSTVNVVGTSKRAWEAHWEGYPITTGTAYKVPIMTLDIVTTYANLLLVDRSEKAIFFGCRDSFWIAKYYTGTELDGWLKFRVVYNGCGSTDPNNYSIYFQDELIELTEESSGAYPDEDSTTGMMYFGSGSSDASLTRTVILKNVYYKISDAYIYLIKDGLVFSHLIYDEPTGYVSIPVFQESSSGVIDALGKDPLNPSYTNAHNGCEVKVKMNESAALITADLHEILFTSGTANTLDINKFYPNYNDRIYIDNHIRNAYYNLLITEDTSDYNDFVNGFGTIPLRFHFRCDTSGAEDTEAALFGAFVAEMNSGGRSFHAQAHTAWTVTLDANWLEQIELGNIALAIHQIVPAFYKFATYSEGYQAYLNASQAERDAYVVMEDQGTLGSYYTSISSQPLHVIEELHNDFGIPYPDGMTPSETDDNQLWWEWVFQAFQIAIATVGESDAATSSGNLWHFIDTSVLGNYPNGTYDYQNHPDLLVPIMNDNLFGTIKHWDKDTYDYYDNLAGAESIFGAQSNTEVITESSEDSSGGWESVQRMNGYASTAYGSFDIGVGKDWMEAPFVEVAFKVKCLRTTGNLPIGLIRWGNYSDDIDFQSGSIYCNEITGATLTNPCSVGVWYEIVLCRYNSTLFVRIYEVDSQDARGECLAFSKQIVVHNNALGEFLIECTGVDCEIRDVHIKASWDGVWYDYPREMGWYFAFEGAGWEIGVTAAEHAENIKKMGLRNALRGYNIKYYSHYFMDPETKAADGTWQGIIDRSYDIWKVVIEWCQDNDWFTQNVEELRAESLSPARVNYIKNGNLSDDIGGLTGEIWGITAGIDSAACVIKDETETTNNSIDGTNVASMAAGQYMLYDFVPAEDGLHFFQFWAKGEFYVSFNTGLYLDYRSLQGNISAADWTFYKMPFYVQKFGPQRVYIKLHCRTGTTYIHKLAVWKDGATRMPDTPTDLVAEWGTEDFAEISFTDNTGGLAQHEIWCFQTSWRDTGVWTLVTTLAAGITSYEDRTWQNSDLIYRVRAKIGSLYSDYVTADSFHSPWVWRMDQGTLDQVYIIDMHMASAGHLAVIHWGDGTTTNVTTISNNNLITKDYSTEGTYWVQITGDIDIISYVEWYNESAQLHDTYVDKWVVPENLGFAHFNNNGELGDITSWYPNLLPSVNIGCHFGVNAITCDVTNAEWPPLYFDLHLQSTLTSSEGVGIYGDISGWTLPDRLAHFQILGYVSGDLTTIIPWVDTTYGSMLISLSSSHPTGFYGDWSGFVIPDRTTGMSLNCNSGCHFTDLPRGAFHRVGLYNFRGNAVSGANLDTLIADIEDYLSTHAPLQNCTYYLDGATMGDISSASVTLIGTIQGYYTAAGFTATFYYNT